MNRSNPGGALLSNMFAAFSSNIISLASAAYLLGYISHGLTYSLWWRSLTLYTNSGIKLMFHVDFESEAKAFNLYCTTATWGFTDTLIVNVLILVSIFFCSTRNFFLKKRSATWHAFKILISSTALLAYASLSLDIIMKLRKNVITKMDDAARIFLIGRYIKAKIFVRLAHIHLLIYALVFIFILMTLSENYNLVTHASRPVTSDSSKKHKDAKKLD